MNDAWSLSGHQTDRQDLVNSLLAAVVSVAHATSQLHRLATLAPQAADETSEVKLNESVTLLTWSARQLVAAADQLSD